LRLRISPESWAEAIMPWGLLVRLRPAGPWRIGPVSGDRNRVDTIYHSDTLYSAVTWAMRDLGLLEEWLRDTAEAAVPAVRFSSCYPYQRKTMFVVPPKTVWPPPPSTRLRYRGARFVAMQFVEALLREEPIDETRWLVDGASECLMPSDRNEGPFRTTIRSAAAVDRVDPTAVHPHSAACLEFAAGCGLWFVCTFANEDAGARWLERVRGAVSLLAETGFGGRRSAGWGACDGAEFFEGELEALLSPGAPGRSTFHTPFTTVITIHKPEGEPAPPTEKGESAWWLLSLFTPSDDDRVDWKRGNYGLVTRSGRARSGELKTPGTMVEEGSVVVCAEEPRGRARNVAAEGPGHPVYRAGFAVSIPVRLRAAS
jgi:CRISPR type III-A-associated RAMP protein Csm4